MGNENLDKASVRRSSAGWARTPPEFSALDCEPWQPITEHLKLAPLETLAPVELGGWIERLRRADVAISRHSSPDLVGQLEQAIRRPIDTVMCGLLDVDPNACLNSALAGRFPLELSAGLIVVARLTHAQRTVIVTDSRVPGRWCGELVQIASETDIFVEPIINDYPQSDPTLMLYALLGRRLRPGRLPTDQGVVLLDAAAAIAVGRLALLNESMRQVPLVVRDHVADRSSYLIAPAGMIIADVLTKLGIAMEGRILRSGDLLRDVQVTAEAKVGEGELILHSVWPASPINPAPCIRCGWCVDSCPTRVQPAALLEACQHNDIELAERAGIEACIECGVCAYICPSQLPLLEGIRLIKEAKRESAHSTGTS